MMTHSISTLEDDDPYADRRVYPRVPVALPAFLQANGERHSVQILDLSSGGAKLNCATGFSVGSTVFLDCGSLGCAAVVRWQNGGLLGLCFEDGLDAREVSALMERSKALAALMKTRA
ncbi:MAG: PilZ domain-containing protein [Sphingomonas bacterium]|nr:PilZ domain-containing protein [Sphingomonas bacterium]